MKRVDFFRAMQKTGCCTVSVRVDMGPSLLVEDAITLYDFLDKEVEDPKAELCEPKDKPQEPKDKLQEPEKAKRKRRVVVDLGKVRALHKAGWSYEKIAEEIGCSVATLMARLKEGRT